MRDQDGHTNTSLGCFLPADTMEGNGIPLHQERLGTAEFISLWPSFLLTLASAPHLPSNYRVFHSCLIQLENCCCFPPGNRFSCCSCTARQGKNNLPGFKTGQSYRFPWCWLYSQQIPGLVSSPLTKATQLADERREANNVIILQQTPALDNCLNSTWHCRGLNVCGQGILMN